MADNVSVPEEAAGQAKTVEMAVAAERGRIASLLRDKAAKLAERGTHGASAAGAVLALADLIDGGDSD